jgi:hypothetical protein
MNTYTYIKNKIKEALIWGKGQDVSNVVAYKKTLPCPQKNVYSAAH